MVAEAPCGCGMRRDNVPVERWECICGAGRPRGTLEERRSRAVRYFELVKERARDNSDLLERFYWIVESFRGKRFDHGDVIREVAALFPRDDEMVTGLNLCLPVEFVVEVQRGSGGQLWVGYTGPGSWKFTPVRLAASEAEVGDWRERENSSPRDVSTVPAAKEAPGDQEDIRELREVGEYLISVKEALGNRKFANFVKVLEGNQGRGDLTCRGVYQLFHPMLKNYPSLLKGLAYFLRVKSGTKP